MLSRSQIELTHLHACLLLQYQHSDQAVLLLKALILAAPDFKPAQYTMTLACLDANECNTCIQWCKTLLQQTETEKKDALYLCLSRAYWRKGEEENAKLSYDKYLLYSKNKKQNKLPTIKQMGGSQ